MSLSQVGVSTAMKDILNFAMLMRQFQQVISGIKDPRKASPNQQYALKDVLLSAFGVFFMQCASFLEYQRQVHSRNGKDNVQSLFGVTQIATDNQIKNILDQIAALHLFGVFEWVYRTLQSGGVLRQYEVLDGQRLVALDGVEYFSSQSVHCACCSHRTHQNGTVTYFHSAILPVIVCPNQSSVLSLPPEFITPQDGHDKQDCEPVAAKRWLQKHQSWFEPGTITLLGDDLYSRQPMCEWACQRGYHYIFGCLPNSHRSLYEWLNFLEANGEIQQVQHRQRHGKDWHLYSYRWLNQIPLRDEQPAIQVNWCELTITRASDDHQIYHNAWITDHFIDLANVAEITSSARARWKTENENHNVLKTKGYHLEHNFGHGKKHLAALLLTLNLLAFLFHTVLQLLDPPYQQIRQRLGTRQRFFNDLRALTCYWVFESWQHLIAFMLEQSVPAKTMNSS